MLYGNVATFDPAKEPGIVQAVVHYLREHGASLPTAERICTTSVPACT